MASFGPLPLGRRRIQARVLVLYRLRPERLAALLPAGLAPRLLHGHAVAAACYTRLEPVLPGTRAQGSEHLAYRFAAARSDGTPTGFVARRATSSWLEARCSRLLRGPQGRARFACSADPFALELAVQGDEGEEFYLRGEAAPAPRAALFAHPHELSEFLAAEEEVQPHDVFAPEADQLELAEGFAPEPLCAFEVRSRFLSSAPFAQDEIELDSAWRLVTRRQVRSPARRASFRMLPERPGTAPLFPTS